MFAFYDFETTGTSPAFDQPLQFAAILTDDNFNEIERVNIRCRLSPHILPAPWALAVAAVVRTVGATSAKPGSKALLDADGVILDP